MKRDMAALVLPDGRFVAGGSVSGSAMVVGPNVFSASEFQAYDASHTDNQTVFRGTRPFPKKGNARRRRKRTVAMKARLLKLNCFQAKKDCRRDLP